MVGVDKLTVTGFTLAAITTRGGGLKGKNTKVQKPQVSASDRHSLEGLSMLKVKVAQEAKERNSDVDRVYGKHRGGRTNGTFEKKQKKLGAEDQFEFWEVSARI